LDGRIKRKFEAGFKPISKKGVGFLVSKIARMKRREKDRA
jgi:hypothetical protein